LRLAITAFAVSTGTAACLPVPRRGRWAALLLGRIPLALTHQTIRDGHGIPPVPGAAGADAGRADLSLASSVAGAGLRELLGRMGRWRVGLRW